MPTPGVTPSTSDAARKTTGTIAAIPKPTSAKPTVAAIGSAISSAPAMPAADSRPPRRTSASAPQALVSRSPTRRPIVIVAEKAAKASAATPAEASSDSRT